MGGNAFASGASALATPRITKEVYIQMRDELQEILLKLFRRVATPFEAPEKPDYGDIDILVADPYEKQVVSEDSIAAKLNAHRWLGIRNSPTTSYAIPHPVEDTFIQVDIHTCPVTTFDWEVFHQSHGDLWNLLGTSIRRKGLTANNEGLFLRIKEIEDLDKKKSMIFLTREPREISKLLSLDEIVLQRSLPTIKDLYNVIEESRFFDPQAYLRGILKANDRKRLNQRRIFRDFVDTVVKGSGISQSLPSRNDVTSELLDHFDKRKEYEDKIKQHRQNVAEALFKRQTKIEKKRILLEDEEYATKWMEWLSQSKGYSN